MKQFPRSAVIPLFAALLLSSCGDDPLLVEKHEKQKAEITRLAGELALIEEKLKNMPPDVSEDLEKAKALSVKQTAEVARLEGEISELEDRKRSLQKEFDLYRAKYQTK